MYTDQQRVPAYIINLKSRSDRREHILQQFTGRNEFIPQLVEPVAHESAASSLWNTIKYIITDLVPMANDYVVICEDDHVFTEYYSRERFDAMVAAARDYDADFCSGGISSVTGCLQVSAEMFWVEKFSGTQFIVLFRKFFPVVLNAYFGLHDTADYKIAVLSESKYFMFPFLSTQASFGYSDVTPRNNEEISVADLFRDTAENIRILKEVSAYYEQRNRLALAEPLPLSFDNISIPTYVINLLHRTERRAHIEHEFKGRPEFDVRITEACPHATGAVGLWESIRRIIQMAISNEDDVIIVAEDDHMFTAAYNKDYLLKNIIEAYHQGAEYLSGGTSMFTIALPVSEHRFWTASCLATQFIVLYKSIFRQILDQTFDDSVLADVLLSKMVSNKMILFPAVSIQKNFGYSDASPAHDKRPAMVDEMFSNSNRRLQQLRNAVTRHQTIIAGSAR